MRIVIAACHLFPDLSQSNATLRNALVGRGVEVPVALWNRDPLDAFVMADLMELSDVARIPQTRVLPTGDVDPSLLPADRVVLKPAFGGGGHGVHAATRDTLARTLLDVRREAPGQIIMAQEFLPEIAEGEWKMTCIEGRVALAVHAVPQEGEFRINNQFGPVVTEKTPPEDARRVAETVLGHLGYPLVARVDGVMRAERFILTEIELTDPDLHLQYRPDVADRLADALIAKVHARAQG